MLSARSVLRRLAQEFGLRFLARRKAACAVAILTMALALGANSAAFSVLKAFLLSSFALPAPDRLFVIAPVRELPGRGEVVFAEAYPNYRLIRATQQSFQDVACVLQGVASWDEGHEVRPLQSARVTASFFRTTRVQPFLGRPIETSEEGPSPAAVVLISHALWQGAFQRASDILGRTMLINGAPHTVIGVMPPGFIHPLPTDIWLPFDVPAQAWTAITGARNLAVYGRLKDDVTPAAARAELSALTRRSIEASADNRDFRYTLQTSRQVLLPEADRTVLISQLGALLLTLLAVLNLAALLIAWGFDRQTEMAVRLTLGAGATRVVRMLILQSVAVVGAGGLLGLMLARLALPALRNLDVSPALALFMDNLRLDLTVLLWSAAAVLAAGLVAGILPAWFGRRAQLADVLRSASRSASLSPAALRWQKGMVLAQAMLCVTIMGAAALVGISFDKLTHVPDGFVAGQRVVARLQLADTEYPNHQSRAAFGERLLQEFAREPELAAVSFSSTLPVSDGLWGGRFLVELPDGSLAAEPVLLHFRRTSANYLASMGIPLLRGRAFSDHDDAQHPAVAIVSRSLAERMWPGQEPVGKRLQRVSATSEPQPLEVVGVVGDVMDAGYNVPAGETVYVPYAQISINRMTVVVRPRSTPEAALAALRRALRKTDSGVAASNTTSLASLVREAQALPRLRAILLLTFALVAIGIVALGSYGVMSQLVASREREFATRLAFGAAPARIGSQVLIQLAQLTLPGAMLGSLAFWFLSGALQPFVFGVQPRSILLLLSVSAGVLLLSSLATLPPALRAMRVNIMKSMAG